MDPVVSSALISGGASALNTLSSMLGMSGSSHYQRKNMRYAAQLQHDENVYWAEYNTPANQMARLKAAGLNPNLVYGNGADAQFNGEVSPSGAAPEFNAHPGTDFLTFQRLMSEQRNLDADSSVKEADAKLKDIEARERESRNPEEYGKTQLADAKKMLDLHGTQQQREDMNFQLDMVRRDLANLDFSIKKEYGMDMAKAQLNRMDIENEMADLNLKNLPRKLQAEYNVSRAQANQLNALVSTYNAQVKEIEQRIQNMKSERELLVKQGKLADAELLRKDAETMAIRLDNIAKSIRNYASAATVPVSVINQYMSPANTAVHALSGFGINVGGMIKNLGVTSSAGYSGKAEVSSSLMPSSMETNYNWY